MAAEVRPVVSRVLAMVSFCVVFCVVLSPVMATQNDALPDPMRPPQASATSPADKSVKSRPVWRLQSILVSPGRRVAVINDRTVAVGERVAGARVLAIRPSGVDIEHEGRRIRLRLPQLKLKKVTP